MADRPLAISFQPLAEIGSEAESGLSATDPIADIRYIGQ